MPPVLLTSFSAFRLLSLGQRATMKLTIFFALVTSLLSQAGLHPLAEVAHAATSTAVLFYGSRAITAAIRMDRSETPDSGATIPAI